MISSPININSVATLIQLHCKCDLGSAGHTAHHRVRDSSTKEWLNRSVLQLEGEWAKQGEAQDGAQQQHCTIEAQEVLPRLSTV